MNLFRSEEHVERWPLLAEGGKAGMADPRRLVAEVFGLPRYSRRLDDDYLDRVGEHSAGLADALKRVSPDPWWNPALTWSRYRPSVPLRRNYFGTSATLQILN